MVVASCHCGAVRLEIAEPPKQVTACNCSICRRLGTLWAYYRPDQIRLIRTPDATVAYVHGDRTLELHHCRNCGCTTHWSSIDPALTDRMGVNVRLLNDPTLLDGVQIRKFDGATTWTYLE